MKSFNAKKSFVRINAKVSDGVVIFLAKKIDNDDVFEGTFTISQVADYLFQENENDIDWNNWKNHAIIAKFLSQYFSCPVLLKLKNNFDPKYIQFGDYYGVKVVPDPT